MPDHRPNKWLSLIVWLLPSSRVKCWALRRLGNTIGEGVTLGPNLVVGCGPFSVGDGTILLSANVFRNLSSVEIGPKSIIGAYNQFTAQPDYQRYSKYVGKLLMGELTIITNRHYFDCSGQIILRPYAGVGGVRSIFQSHEADLAEDTTKVGRIILDVRSMSGTACVFLKDSHLPERSILAAGSLMAKTKDGVLMPTSTLYAGVPARAVREISDLRWWARESYNTPVVEFDDEQFKLTYFESTPRTA